MKILFTATEMYIKAQSTAPDGTPDEGSDLYLKVWDEDGERDMDENEIGLAVLGLIECAEDPSIFGWSKTPDEYFDYRCRSGDESICEPCQTGRGECVHVRAARKANEVST